METYYNPADLAKFAEIGKDAPELANKFFDYYGAVFADCGLTRDAQQILMRGEIPCKKYHHFYGSMIKPKKL